MPKMTNEAQNAAGKLLDLWNFNKDAEIKIFLKLDLLRNI